MPIEYKKNLALFFEVVSVEEAEGLLEWLHKKSAAKVDLSACTHMHPANLQVLMAAKAHIISWPEDTNLQVWLKTAFKP